MDYFKVMNSMLMRLDAEPVLLGQELVQYDIRKGRSENLDISSLICFTSWTPGSYMILLKEKLFGQCWLQSLAYEKGFNSKCHALNEWTEG